MSGWCKDSDGVWHETEAGGSTGCGGWFQDIHGVWHEKATAEVTRVSEEVAAEVAAEVTTAPEEVAAEVTTAGEVAECGEVAADLAPEIADA